MHDDASTLIARHPDALLPQTRADSTPNLPYGRRDKAASDVENGGSKHADVDHEYDGDDGSGGGGDDDGDGDGDSEDSNSSGGGGDNNSNHDDDSDGDDDGDDSDSDGSDGDDVDDISLIEISSIRRHLNHRVLGAVTGTKAGATVTVVVVALGTPPAYKYTRIS